MATLCAAARCKMNIDQADVILANTILSYTEHFMPKALGEFGKARHADVAAAIMKLLEPLTKPQTAEEIYPHVGNDLDKIEDLQQILSKLSAANKIIWVPKTGTNKSGWLIARKQLGGNKLFVDYNWLKEFDQFKPT